MFLSIVLFLAALNKTLAAPRIVEMPMQDDFEVYHRSALNLHRSTRAAVEEENTAVYWKTQAQDSLTELITKKLNTNVAKNTILFIGDGMSIPTITASRIYGGQLQNQTGEEAELSFDKFPYVGLSKTYCVDSQVADSACTATAYLCGVKANRATIGVTGNVPYGNCSASLNADNHVYSIARWSQLEGKRTGIVTTTTVTHASPAGAYAHTSNRNWECDSDVISSGENPEQCRDIAYQLVFGETGENFNVILGGGRGKFMSKSETGPQNDAGERSDGRNLITSWLAQKEERGETPEYVWNRDELLNVSNTTTNLLGLFASGHCSYNLEANKTTQPTLAEMTEAAIKILSQSEEGFFLFVEGGRIDHGHHSSYAKKALDETVQFSEAVQKAIDLTSSEDTLIVISSDHAHTMSFSGYPTRGSDILGIADTAEDGLPYSTLSYANGPGYQVEADGSRHDLNEDDMHGNSYVFPATAPLSSETHGGDDVGIFASGPWAHLLSGVVQQNLIPHAMAYASCVGEGTTVCSLEEKASSSSSNPFTFASILILIAMTLSNVAIHYFL